MNAASFYLSASSGDRPVVGSTPAVDLISSSTIIEPGQYEVSFTSKTEEEFSLYPAVALLTNSYCYAELKSLTSPAMRTTYVIATEPFRWI